MAVSQATLRSCANRASLRKAVPIMEAKASGKQTAFLCHSHKDRELAKGVQVFLQDQEWDVYIDWEDTTMPNKPDERQPNRFNEKFVIWIGFYF